MQVVKPPYKTPIETNVSLFLGGTIDMGNSKDWQSEVIESLKNLDITVYNPRRDDWDSSWVQDPTPGTKFYEQVMWEMSRQYDADIILYHFEPNSKSPITFLELGAFGVNYDISETNYVIVSCPTSFYRYGNIAIFCQIYKIPLFNNLEVAVQYVKKVYEDLNYESI